jgi:hypothetical protein
MIYSHIGIDPILLIVRIKKRPAEEFADDCPSDCGMGGTIRDSTTTSKYKTRAIIIGIVALTVPSPITGCSVTLPDKPSQNALHHAEISHPARWEDKGTQRQDGYATGNTRFAPASKPERVAGRRPQRRRA